MAHHGSSPLEGLDSDGELAKHFAKLTGFQEALGATGKHPQGHMGSEDEGEIQYRVGADGDKVFMDFGKKPVAWVGMDPQQAADLGASLIRHARTASKRAQTVLRVEI